jgi:hypothetical protein
MMKHSSSLTQKFSAAALLTGVALAGALGAYALGSNVPRNFVSDNGAIHLTTATQAVCTPIYHANSCDKQYLSMKYTERTQVAYENLEAARILCSPYLAPQIEELEEKVMVIEKKILSEGNSTSVNDALLQTAYLDINGFHSRKVWNTVLYIVAALGSGVISIGAGWKGIGAWDDFGYVLKFERKNRAKEESFDENDSSIIKGR